MGYLLVGKIRVLGQREWELGEGELSPSASHQGVPEAGNGSRVRTLPATAMPTEHHNSTVMATSYLLALGVCNCQRIFDGFWVNVRCVNLFPEHGGETLDLGFGPIDEGFTRTA